MKQTIFAILLLWLANTAVAEDIQWHNNLQPAMNEAKESGRPVLIDFWADWCAPCKVMDSKLWKTAEGKQLASRFVCIRLDFDRAARAVGNYRIDTIPAVVFTDSWGNFITKIVGFDDPEEYTRVMKLIPGDFKPVDRWNAALSRNSENREALRALGRFYFESGVYDVSNMYYEKALNQAQSEELKSDIQLAIGWNYLKMKDYKEARKVFEQCLKRKELATRDVALFGMVVSSLALKKRKDAEKAFDELSKNFPDSKATAQARRILSNE